MASNNPTSYRLLGNKEVQIIIERMAIPEHCYVDRHILQGHEDIVNFFKSDIEGAMQSIIKRWELFGEKYPCFVKEKKETFSTLLRMTGKVIFQGRFLKEVPLVTKAILKDAIVLCGFKFENGDSQMLTCLSLSGMIDAPWTSFISIPSTPVERQDYINSVWQNECYVLLLERFEVLISQKLFDPISFILEMFISKGLEYTEPYSQSCKNELPGGFPFDKEKLLQYGTLYVLIASKCPEKYKAAETWNMHFLQDIITSLNTEAKEASNNRLCPKLKEWKIVGHLASRFVEAALWIVLKRPRCDLVGLATFLELILSSSAANSLEEDMVDSILIRKNEVCSCLYLYTLAEVVKRNEVGLPPEAARLKFIKVCVCAMMLAINHIEEKMCEEDINTEEILNCLKHLSAKYIEMAETFKAYPSTSFQLVLTAHSLHPQMNLFKRLFPEFNGKSSPVDHTLWESAETLGLYEDLYVDFRSMVSSPRIKSICSWTSIEDLKQLCKDLVVTGVGKFFKKYELNYVNVDFEMFTDTQPLPENDDTGVEKGYEDDGAADEEEDEEGEAAQPEKLTNITNEENISKTADQEVKKRKRGRPPGPSSKKIKVTKKVLKKASAGQGSMNAEEPKLARKRPKKLLSSSASKQVITEEMKAAMIEQSERRITLFVEQKEKMLNKYRKLAMKRKPFNGKMGIPSRRKSKLSMQLPEIDALIELRQENDTLVVRVPENATSSNRHTEKDILVDRLPEKDTLVDRLPEKDTLVDRLPEKDTLVDRLPEKDTLVDRLPETDTLVDRLPENDTLLGVRHPENDTLLGVRHPENDTLLGVRNSANDTTKPHPESDLTEQRSENDVLPERRAESDVTESEVGVLPESEVGVLPESEVDVLPESEQAVLPESEVGVLPESEVGGLPESEVDVLPESEVGVLPESEVDVLPESEIVVLPEPEVGVLPESEVDVLPESEVGVLPESEVDVLPESEVGVLPESEVGVLPESEVGVLPESEQAVLLESEINGLTEQRAENDTLSEFNSEEGSISEPHTGNNAVAERHNIVENDAVTGGPNLGEMHTHIQGHPNLEKGANHIEKNSTVETEASIERPSNLENEAAAERHPNLEMEMECDVTRQQKKTLEESSELVNISNKAVDKIAISNNGTRSISPYSDASTIFSDADVEIEIIDVIESPAGNKSRNLQRGKANKIPIKSLGSKKVSKTKKRSENVVQEVTTSTAPKVIAQITPRINPKVITREEPKTIIRGNTKVTTRKPKATRKQPVIVRKQPVIARKQPEGFTPKEPEVIVISDSDDDEDSGKIINITNNDNSLPNGSSEHVLNSPENNVETETITSCIENNSHSNGSLDLQVIEDNVELLDEDCPCENNQVVDPQTVNPKDANTNVAETGIDVESLLTEVDNVETEIVRINVRDENATYTSQLSNCIEIDEAASGPEEILPLANDYSQDIETSGEEEVIYSGNHFLGFPNNYQSGIENQMVANFETVSNDMINETDENQGGGLFSPNRDECILGLPNGENEYSNPNSPADLLDINITHQKNNTNYYEDGTMPLILTGPGTYTVGQPVSEIDSRYVVDSIQEVDFIRIGDVEVEVGSNDDRLDNNGQGFKGFETSDCIRFPSQTYRSSFQLSPAQNSVVGPGSVDKVVDVFEGVNNGAGFSGAQNEVEDNHQGARDQVRIRADERDSNWIKVSIKLDRLCEEDLIRHTKRKSDTADSAIVEPPLKRSTRTSKSRQCNPRLIKPVHSPTKVKSPESQGQPSGVTRSSRKSTKDAEKQVTSPDNASKVKKVVPDQEGFEIARHARKFMPNFKIPKKDQTTTKPTSNGKQSKSPLDYWQQESGSKRTKPSTRTKRTAKSLPKEGNPAKGKNSDSPSS